MQVDFYHLVASPIERVLPRLVEGLRSGGARLLIVAEDAARREALDRLLWTYSADSFLPHGQAGGEDDAEQPVLLAAAVEPSNGAQHVLLTDGRWRDEALAFERAFHFFDGEQVEAARAAWKALAGRDDVERRYWKQNDAGRWEQAA